MKHSPLQSLTSYHDVGTSPSSKALESKAHYLEIETFPSSPRNTTNIKLQSLDMTSKNSRSIQSFAKPSSPKSPPSEFKSQHLRNKTLRIFQQGRAQKEMDHQDTKKQASTNDMIRKDDSLAYVASVVEAARKEPKTKPKGIMYINELWANKYERQTIKAAQLEKELHKAQTRYLDVLKNKPTIGKLKEKELGMISRMEHSTSPRYEGKKKLTSKTNLGSANAFFNLENVTANPTDIIYPRKPDYLLSYPKGVQSERSPANRIGSQDYTSRQAVDPEEGKTGREVQGKESNVVSARVHQIQAEAMAPSSITDRHLKGESETPLRKGTKSPDLKVGLNDFNKELDFLSKAHAKDTSRSGNASEARVHKLSILIDKCNTELEERGSFVSAMNHMRGVFKESMYKNIKKTDPKKTRIIESCRSAIEYKTNLERSFS